MLALLLTAAIVAPDYAVLVSRRTDADPSWHKVVQKLTEKHHGASVIIYDGDISTARDALAAQMPLYTAVVAKPDELGRGVVASVHRMMRRLDVDPYTDTLWGIVTGYTPDDALALVSDDQPLVMKRAISTTGVNGDLFDQVFTASDGSEGQWSYKRGDKGLSGGTNDNNERKSDRAALFAQYFKQISPDLIVTSSHGFENGIEMPWGHGMLVGRAGDLAILPQKPPAADGTPGKGLDKPVKVEPSANPKVFLPVGNCLVGHIDPKHTKDSLILALQHSAAVRQSVGYTVETWYGRAGWGTLGLLQSQPGQLTVAQAWFFNQQQIIEELRTRHPKAAAFDYDWTDNSSVESFMSAAQQAGLNPKDKDEMGLAFDRDVVALYGDPAYDARLDAGKWNAPYVLELARVGARWRIRVTPKGATKLADLRAPVMIMLPVRCPDPIPLGTLPTGTILTDLYVIVPDIAAATGGAEGLTLWFQSRHGTDDAIRSPLEK